MPLTKIPRIDRYLTLLPGSLRKSHNTYKIRGRSTRAKPASWVSQSTRASGPNTTWYNMHPWYAPGARAATIDKYVPIASTVFMYLRDSSV